jgi:hypothetical protein
MQTQPTLLAIVAVSILVLQDLHWPGALQADGRAETEIRQALASEFSNSA